jgi:mono/diheme cytochrome c family protein
LLRRFCAFSIGSLAILALAVSAQAAPRESTPREGGQRPGAPAPRNQPSATVPQTEPMDLDEGKSGQQMFSSSCSVCHQGAQGLAKGRSPGQLGAFLRQHYTTGTNQANALAGYLTSGGLDRGTPTPVRASPADKPEKPEPTTTARKPKPDETRGRPDPAVAATHPQRRIRNEDGTTQPVEGLVVLPPGASDVPDGYVKPAERRRETRPEAAPGRQRQPRPSDIKPAEQKPAETKPAEPAQPVETAKPAEPEPAPVQAEAPRPPRDPAGAHSSLTEERPKPAPADVQEIPL